MAVDDGRLLSKRAVEPLEESCDVTASSFATVATYHNITRNRPNRSVHTRHDSANPQPMDPMDSRPSFENL